jgi:Rrf2 family protein
MRISTKGRYALRAMVELAQQATLPVTRQRIAERQGISADYLAQLFRLLREAGLVRSARGPQGGYQLARGANEISVGEVIRAVEGPLALSTCTLFEPEHHCARARDCLVRPLWARATRAINALLDSVTLLELCEGSLSDRQDGEVSARETLRKGASL